MRFVENPSFLSLASKYSAISSSFGKTDFIETNSLNHVIVSIHIASLYLIKIKKKETKKRGMPIHSSPQGYRYTAFQGFDRLEFCNVDGAYRNSWGWIFLLQYSLESMAPLLQHRLRCLWNYNLPRAIILSCDDKAQLRDHGRDICDR